MNNKNKQEVLKVIDNAAKSFNLEITEDLKNEIMKEICESFPQLENDSFDFLESELYYMFELYHEVQEKIASRFKLDTDEKIKKEILDIINYAAGIPQFKHKNITEDIKQQVLNNLLQDEENIKEIKYFLQHPDIENDECSTWFNAEDELAKILNL